MRECSNRLRLACIAVALALAACGGPDEAATPDSTSIAGAPAVVQPSPQAVAGSNSCPHTGKWALCTLERRMRQAGFVVKRIEGETPARAGFRVNPVVYSLGRSRLEVFLYDDPAGTAADMAGLDTVLAVPRGSTISPWETTPTLIRSGNLAAVFLTSSPLQAERLVLAITAGAPQPGSPR